MDHVHRAIDSGTEMSHDFSMHSSELLLSNSLVSPKYSVPSLKDNCEILQADDHPQYLAKDEYISEMRTEMTLNDFDNRYREIVPVSTNYTKMNAGPSYEMKSLNQEIQDLSFPDDLRSLNRESTSTFGYYSKNMSLAPDIYNQDFPSDFTTNNFANTFPSTLSMFSQNDIGSYAMPENQTDEMLLNGMSLNENDKLLLSDELSLLAQGKSGLCFELTYPSGEIFYAVVDQENEFGSLATRIPTTTQKEMLNPRHCSLPVTMESDLSQLSESHFENNLPEASNYTSKSEHQSEERFDVDSRHYHPPLLDSMSKPISSSSITAENFNLCCDFPTTDSSNQFPSDVNSFSSIVSKKHSSFDESPLPKSNLMYPCASTVTSEEETPVTQSSAPILVNDTSEQTSKIDYFPSAVNSIIVSETGKKYPKKYSFYSNNISSYLNQDTSSFEKTQPAQMNSSKLCNLPSATSVETDVQDLSMSHSMCTSVSQTSRISMNNIATTQNIIGTVSARGESFSMASRSNKVDYLVDLSDENDKAPTLSSSHFIDENLFSDEDKMKNKFLNARAASVVNSICDQAVPSRARATLPFAYLSINRIQKGSQKPLYGVFAHKCIPSRTQFGPLEGVLVKSEEDENDSDSSSNKDGNGFQLTLQGQNGKFLQLDVSDENMSNWMRFVRPASNFKEQNLIVNQEGDYLYFTSIEVIQPEKELRVWYSAPYSQIRHLKLLPDDPRNDGPVSYQLSNDANNFSNFEQTDKACEKTVFDKAINSETMINDNSSRPIKLNTCDNENQEQPHNLNDHSLEKKNTFTPVKKSSKQYEKPNKKLWLCNHCDLSFFSMAVMNIHALEHSKRIVVTEAAVTENEIEDLKDNSCPQCSKTFEDKKKLISHVFKHGVKVQKWKDKKSTDFSSDQSEDTEEDSVGKFPCQYCTRKLKTAGALRLHERCIHSDKATIYCPMCDANFEKLSALQEHIPFHAKNGIFTCPHCPKTYDQYKCIRKHIRSYHASASHLCKQCKKGFRSLSKLNLHMLKHSNQRSYLCSNCGKQFKRVDKLTEHIKNIHSEEREKINEKTMEVALANKANKKILKRKRIPKKVKCLGTENVNNYFFKCYICEIGFKRRGMLVNHLSSLHPDISWNTIPELNVPILKACCQFFCQYCDRVYKSKSKRKEHILKSHPGLQIPGDAERGTVMNDPYAKHVKNVILSPFNCEYCHRQYASRAKLLHHHRIHHNDLLPYEKKIPKNRSPRKKKRQTGSKGIKITTDVTPNEQEQHETITITEADLQMPNMQFQIMNECDSTVNIATQGVISLQVVKDDNENGTNDLNQVALPPEQYLKIFQIPVVQNDENSTVLQQLFTSYQFSNAGVEH